MTANIKGPADDELVAYWESKKEDDRLPARGDIDPIDIPKLLPHIGLIDVIDGGADFRYRLLGTRLNEVFGEDFTGQLVSETKQGEYGELLLDLYRSVVTERAPIVSESVFEYKGKEHLNIHRLLLPLAKDGEEVDMIMFMNRFQMRDRMVPRRGQGGRSSVTMFTQDRLVGTKEVSRRRV